MKTLHVYMLKLPVDLWRAVKSKAAGEGVTVREIIEKMLREYLAQ